MLTQTRGGFTGGVRGDAPPLDGCWPENRDATPIVSKFYQSQTAQTSLFVLKNRKNFWGGGTAFSPDSFLWEGGHPFPTPNPIDPRAYGARMDLRLWRSTYGTSAQAPPFAP